MTLGQWVFALGGPHILIPYELCALWKGADSSSERPWAIHEGQTLSDYYAACDIHPPIGLLPMEMGTVLVIPDDPVASTWVPSTRYSGGILVVATDWDTEPVVPEIDPVQATCQADAWEPTGVVLPKCCGQYWLMTASDAYTRLLNPVMPVTLPADRYTIQMSTAVVGPWSFLLFGLDGSGVS